MCKPLDHVGHLEKYEFDRQAAKNLLSSIDDLAKVNWSELARTCNVQYNGKLVKNGNQVIRKFAEEVLELDLLETNKRVRRAIKKLKTQSCHSLH